jgi:hypothetical protein
MSAHSNNLWVKALTESNAAMRRIIRAPESQRTDEAAAQSYLGAFDIPATSRPLFIQLLSPVRLWFQITNTSLPD